MNHKQLESLNIGENLDALMNLDPRGYGVCRMLYAGSRAYTGQPLTINAANQLISVVRAGDTVFIITGFILLPHRVPETDGLVSSLLLARAIVSAFEATPILICPEDCVKAVHKCAQVIGLHAYEDISTALSLPLSMGVVAFTKDNANALSDAQALLKTVTPAAVIAVEAPGANEKGVYHNAAGMDVTALEAKTDVLWNLLREQRVPSIAIGDLGNEIGMGTIAQHIRRYIPRADVNECRCDCKGGILAASTADAIITATCSDWGCYGLIAAIAYLKKNMDILHSDEMEAETLRAASRNGMVDMNGSLVPGVDGFDVRMMVGVLNLMRQCTAYALKHACEFEHWYAAVLEKPFYPEQHG
jgi:hypothetical protein